MRGASAAARRRAAWYRDYIETLVQRDVRDLARISSLDVLPRLLTLAAGQTARLLNVSDLEASFEAAGLTAGTSTCMSMRSKSGPEILA